MDEKIEQAYETLRSHDLKCECIDCDAFGCVDRCIMCKITDEEALEIANKFDEITYRS